MSTKTVKLVLTNADIPLVYEQISRATIDNTDAAPRLPSSFSGSPINTDYATADLIYAENIMPFAKGIYSVGYVQQTFSIPGAALVCDRHIQLRDINENIRAFIPAGGLNYVYNPTTSVWVSTSPFAFVGSLITRAYVAGRTFICYEKNRIIELDAITGLFTTIALTYPLGLSIADVRGIGGASNYLLLFTEFAVYWCAPANILEFADINQGAGNQTPVDIKGQITALLPLGGGFVIYTARNAVGATFTNNAAAPFVFKEINNAGGVPDWEHVTPEANETGHYAYGTNGLQLVGLNKAVNIFPEVTDFLTGGQVESWNSVTKEVTRVNSLAAFVVRLAFLGGRYLVISYGPGTNVFEYALIYDTSLERWGKLRTPHVDAFMYGYASGTGALTYDQLTGNYDTYVIDYATLGLFYLAVIPPKQGIAFLKNDGSIFILQPQFIQSECSAVAIFGRIQSRHGRKATIQSLELDGLKTNFIPYTYDQLSENYDQLLLNYDQYGNGAVTVLSGVHGYDRDTATPMVEDTVVGNFRKFNKRVTAENHDVSIEGTFVLSSALITIAQHGSR